MNTFIVIVISLTTICKGADDYDRSNWIDPSDMLNNDASTQKMKYVDCFVVQQFL